MQAEEPLVSIVIPSYNHAAFIQTCIESIINQSYRNIELIVIDDGSSDESPAILKNLQDKHGFKLILRENRGLAPTVNEGLKNHATGKYVAMCASDDYWVKDKLAIQVSEMEKHPEWGMCYGKNHFVDNKGNVVEGYARDNHLLKGGYIFEELLLFRFHPHVNYMIRRDVLAEAGFYDERFATEDFYMNLKITSKYPVGYIDQYIGYYRIPSGPAKIGSFDKLTRSHIDIINQYRHHSLHRKAVQTAWLRNFDTYSGFVQFKGRAVKNMWKATPLFYHKRFIIALIKLLFVYKSVNE